MKFFAQLTISVRLMKETVILMRSVKMVFFVDQTIAQLHPILTMKMIVVIKPFLGMIIFVQRIILAKEMKGIVIQIKIAKEMKTNVASTIVKNILALTLWLIVA